MLSGGGARGAYQVGVLQYLAREFPDGGSRHPDRCLGGRHQRRVPRRAAGALSYRRSTSWPRCGATSASTRCSASTRDSGVARAALGRPADLRRQVAAAAGEEHGRHQAAAAKCSSASCTAADGADRRASTTSLRDGWLRAFALTASSYTTGQSITWVQTREDCAMPAWERPLRKSTMCALRIDHVMASAALPFFFPAIEVDGAWYGDGGIRLTQPLSPAIHLGAKRILAVTTRYASTREEADRPSIVGYPPPAQVAGMLFNAIFLDQLDGDAMQLRQINTLIEAHPEDKRIGPAADRAAGAAAVRGSRAAGERTMKRICRRRSASSRAASARRKRARTTCSAW